MPARPLLALLLIVLGHSCGNSADPTPAPAERADAPGYDVLLIAVDDLRDWVGCLGTDSGARTPSIDRLAARGVVFRRAYCPAPLCNPSRVAILTGVPPHVSGVYTNSQDWRPRLPGVVTLPRHFREHGYRAIGAGKLFHDAYREDESFDDYFHGGTSAQPPFAEIPLHGEKGLPSHFDWGPIDRGIGSLRDWRVAERARARLAMPPDEPMLLAVGFYRPHLPWYAPPAFFERHPLDAIRLPEVKEDDLADVPDAARSLAEPELHERIAGAGKWKEAVQGYLASIEVADRCVGRVLDALDASPRASRTIVVLFGDHGWHLGEKQHWRKSTLWEEAARVPLVIVAPGIAPEGAVCDRPVSLMDVYPTLIELCGLPEREDVESGERAGGAAGAAGRSLVPLLRNPSAEWSHAALTTHGAGNHSVRDERWRYTRYADGSEELYDHDADPREWTNVAERAENAEVIARLRALLPESSAPDLGPDPKAKPNGEGGDEAANDDEGEPPAGEEHDVEGDGEESGERDDGG